jgi:hypothetical protein
VRQKGPAQPRNIIAGSHENFHAFFLRARRMRERKNSAVD